MTYDLVIHNGTIVTVNERFDVIPQGLLCIKGGTQKKGSGVNCAKHPKGRSGN